MNDQPSVKNLTQTWKIANITIAWVINIQSRSKCLKVEGHFGTKLWYQGYILSIYLNCCDLKFKTSLLNLITYYMLKQQLFNKDKNVTERNCKIYRGKQSKIVYHCRLNVCQIQI